MTIIIGFNKSDIIKVILNPPIASLNDFLAVQMNKLIYSNYSQSIIKEGLYNLLIQFIFNYDIFRRITDM